jgi:NAD(P)-dependent dehydrogenase (short-subunit alcohol dehydrogenase family)
MAGTPSTRRVALVTGANRGLGLETCRQLAAKNFQVVLTARRENEAREAAEHLGTDHVQLDVNEAKSIERAATVLGERYEQIDVLVNNAGISLGGSGVDVAKRTIAVNLIGAMAVTSAFRPILAEYASIVMVSSGLGELSCLSPARRRDFEDPELSRDGLVALMQEYIQNVEDGTYEAKGWSRSAYNVSKVGLNALTRILARELEGTGTLVNAVCPGWVRTDMGGRAAPRGVTEGARSIVWAATLPKNGVSGGFFRDGLSIPW